MQVDLIKDGSNWLAYTGDNPVNKIDGYYFGYSGEGGSIDNESGLQNVTYQESDEIKRVCSRLKINRKQECCLRKHAVKIYKSFDKKKFDLFHHNCTQYAMKVLKSCGFNVRKYPLIPSWNYWVFVNNN